MSALLNRLIRAIVALWFFCFFMKADEAIYDIPEVTND